jgi:hypothetical protein
MPRPRRAATTPSSSLATTPSTRRRANCIT